MTLSNSLPQPNALRALLATIMLLSIFMMLSCSPEKKLSKLLTKHPELLHKDSIHTRDTIVRPGVSSVAKGKIPESTRDTITIHDTINHVTTRYVSLPGDSIYIRVDCPSDTTFIEKIRIVEKYRDSEPWYKEIFNAVPWWVIVIAILALTGWILSKIFK